MVKVLAMVGQNEEGKLKGDYDDDDRDINDNNDVIGRKYLDLYSYL